MLSYGMAVVVVLAWVGVSLGLLTILRRLWPVEGRQAHNEIVGWQISVIGTIYAVLLAFMLYNVWENFRAARVNMEQEANRLVTLYRVAEGFPESDRAAVQKTAREYAQVMIVEEWPAMDKQRLSPRGKELAQQFWVELAAVQKNNPSGVPAVGQALSELSSLTEHRRVRQLESQTSLPGILWLLLLAGGAITVSSACLLGSQNSGLHIVLVFFLSLIMGLALCAIAMIDRPFQGPIHVQPDGFRMAIETFDQFVR
jgi:Protein of unknown function (DUF4239)